MCTCWSLKLCEEYPASGIHRILQGRAGSFLAAIVNCKYQQPNLRSSYRTRACYLMGKTSWTDGIMPHPLLWASARLCGVLEPIDLGVFELANGISRVPSKFQSAVLVLLSPAWDLVQIQYLTIIWPLSQTS